MSDRQAWVQLIREANISYQNPDHRINTPTHAEHPEQSSVTPEPFSSFNISKAFYCVYSFHTIFSPENSTWASTSISLWALFLENHWLCNFQTSNLQRSDKMHQNTHYVPTRSLSCESSGVDSFATCVSCSAFVGTLLPPAGQEDGDLNL